MANEVWVVLGLGNPGEQYTGNRHNIGHRVVNELAAEHNTRFTRHKSLAMVAEVRPTPGGPKVVAAKALSFMNQSGGAAAGLLKYYGLEAERLIVVHDELDLPYDRIRLKKGGGHGGHNGLRDISKAIGPDYIRVRLGVGRPPGQQDPAAFVLSDFTKAERDLLPNYVGDAVDAVRLLVTEGLLDAQQRIHSPN